MKLKIFLLSAFLIMAQLCFAGDIENGSVSWTEGGSFIAYSDTAQFTTNCETDNLYTSSMWIANLVQDSTSAKTAGLTLWARCGDMTGTEDVNVTVEFCYEKIPNDSAFVAAGGGGSLDQVQTTAKNTYAYPPYPGALWARVKNDGQTGNPTNTWIRWGLYGKKIPGSLSDKTAGAKEYVVE